MLRFITITTPDFQTSSTAWGSGIVVYGNVQKHRIDNGKPGNAARPARQRETIPRAGLAHEMLRKERFRREAAEAAQKQLERMALQLRTQLGKDISARQAAEALAADLLARSELNDQIDRERERLHTERIATLEKRRSVLERRLNIMSKRLATERTKRQQLETDKTARIKIISVGPKSAAAETKVLKIQVDALKRQLAATEWARKLAEAQLKLITDKFGDQ